MDRRWWKVFLNCWWLFLWKLYLVITNPIKNPTSAIYVSTQHPTSIRWERKRKMTKDKCNAIIMTFRIWASSWTILLKVIRRWVNFSLYFFNWNGFLRTSKCWPLQIINNAILKTNPTTTLSTHLNIPIVIWGN